MAKKRKAASRPLAEVRAGDVFVVPLANGLWGACRAIQKRDDPLTALVATSPWVGSEPPALNEPGLLVVLRLTHHSWHGEPCMGWVTDAPPPDFVYLGNVASAADAEGADWSGAGRWLDCPGQGFLQWRWDNEREAVLAEAEEERRRQEEGQERCRQAYKPLPKQTLEELRKQPFAGWQGYVETNALRAARKIIRTTIDALRALGPDAPEPLKLNLFHACVERFNDLDDGWICTIEREDVCELLYDLADLVGLEEYGEALTGRRDW